MKKTKNNSHQMYMDSGSHSINRNGKLYKSLELEEESILNLDSDTIKCLNEKLDELSEIVQKILTK